MTTKIENQLELINVRCRVISHWRAKAGSLNVRTYKTLGLKTLLSLKQQEGIKVFKGKLKWEGDLEQIRTDFHAGSKKALAFF